MTKLSSGKYQVSVILKTADVDDLVTRNGDGSVEYDDDAVLARALDVSNVQHFYVYNRTNEIQYNEEDQ